MDAWASYIEVFFKVFFYILVPAATLIARVKKKIGTGFAAGIILTSFILGILSSASFQENASKDFMKAINRGDYEAAKKAYKIVIQYGPEYVERIDERRIIEKDMYSRMRKDIISEYQGIIRKYLDTYTLPDSTDCGDKRELEKILDHLKHARKLHGYAKSINGAVPELKKRLNGRIEKGRTRLERLEESCE